MGLVSRVQLFPDRETNWDDIYLRHKMILKENQISKPRIREMRLCEWFVCLRNESAELKSCEEESEK
jgi:hypothetical protein